MFRNDLGDPSQKTRVEPVRSPRELRKNEFGHRCASNNFESEVGSFLEGSQGYTAMWHATFERALASLCACGSLSKVVESAVCVGILFPNTPRGIIGGSEEDKSSSQKVSRICE